MTSATVPRLHHYSLTSDVAEESVEIFRDVRFVLVAGSVNRVEAQAEYLQNHRLFGDAKLKILTVPQSRFKLIKLGRCLLSDHGMGSPSMSIAIHELFLLCRFAGILDKIILIRFGTCGGIGVEPGTICITRRTLDPLFRDFVELKICGKLVKRPCVIDEKSFERYLNIALTRSRPQELGTFEVVSGSTVATNDFYEEQARTSGAICDHREEDKMRYLKEAHDLGVINIEMESNHLAALSYKCGVSFVVVCVALANRLVADEVAFGHAQIALFEQRLFWLNMEFIKSQLES